MKLRPIVVTGALAGLLLVPANRAEGTEAVSGAVPPAPTTYSASGADAAAITPTVDAFRADLGTDNGDATGASTGRREINWDDVPDAHAAPAMLPSDFYRTT